MKNRTTTNGTRTFQEWKQDQFGITHQEWISVNRTQNQNRNEYEKKKTERKINKATKVEQQNVFQ